MFDANFRVYGVRKVWRQLRREGFDVARCTVARLMKQMGIEASSGARRSTIPDKAAPCPLDRVNRQFRTLAPNMLWVSDFTYVATWQAYWPRRLPHASVPGGCGVLTVSSRPRMSRQSSLRRSIRFVSGSADRDLAVSVVMVSEAARGSICVTCVWPRVKLAKFDFCPSPRSPLKSTCSAAPLNFSCLSNILKKIHQIRSVMRSGEYRP